jgi:hypothetical protein
MSPFYVNKGLNPRLIPLDLAATPTPAVDLYLDGIQGAMTEAAKRIKHNNDLTASYANHHRQAASFSVGDQVLLSTKHLQLDSFAGTRKLMPKFIGPFAIIEVINDVTFRLDLSPPLLSRGIHNTFHASLLRPYHRDNTYNRSAAPPPPVSFDDGHVEYEVERILSVRRKRSGMEYLVKWLGYGDHENSWLPASALANSPDLLASFHRSDDSS